MKAALLVLGLVGCATPAEPEQVGIDPSAPPPYVQTLLCAHEQWATRPTAMVYVSAITMNRADGLGKFQLCSP
jgi:hypothetical protein